jgi:hypothetical protein
MHHPGAPPRVGQLANGLHQGTPIPWFQRHKLMKSMGDGGPARTRTWDYGKCVMAIFQPLTSFFTAQHLRRNTYSTQSKLRRILVGQVTMIAYCSIA